MVRDHRVESKENTFQPIKEENDAILPRQQNTQQHTQPAAPHASTIQQQHHQQMMSMKHHQQHQGAIPPQSRHHPLSMMHQPPHHANPHHHSQQQQHHAPPPLQPELFNGGGGSPPSPPVPDDPELVEKIKQRFELKRTDPHSTCSRCERIYTFKRPKKQRNPENDVSPSICDCHIHIRTPFYKKTVKKM